MKLRNHQSTSLALLSLGTALAVGAAQAAPLDDMVAFDAAYIPALATSTGASLDAAVAPKALGAMAALQRQWPALQQRLLITWGARPPVGWQRTLTRVGRHINVAADASNKSDWMHAHEVLEPVRIELMNARLSQGMDYFVDHLTAFHTPMETLALAGSTLRPDQLNATRRAELTRAYAKARTLWRRIEQQPVDAKAYGLSGARLAQLRKAIEDEGSALEQLSQALRETDDARLLKAAAAIKPPFARAFTAFGQPEAVGTR